MKTPTIILALFISSLIGCTSVKEVDILSVKLTPTSPDSDDIPYGSTATVTVWAKLDGNAGKNGYKIPIELWESDGGDAVDDKLVKKTNIKIKANLTRGTASLSITCKANSGELSGSGGSDSDDDTAGGIRTYEIYAYDTGDKKESANRTVRCIPPEEEEEEGSGSEH